MSPEDARAGEAATQRPWWTAWMPFMPPGMAATLALGTVLCFGSAGGMIWAFGHGAKSVNHDSCKAQLDRRDATRDDEDQKLTTSERRIELLNRALTMLDSPSFTDARTALAQEEAYAARLKTIRRDLEVDPDDPVQEGAMIAAAAPVLWLFVLGLLIHLGQLLQPSAATFRGWWKPCVASASLVMVAIMVGEYFASVAAIDKTWFGHDSWCIDRRAFWLNKLGLAGGQLMAGCIVALFAVATRKEHRPFVDLRAPRCGVGPYVDFALVWMVVGTFVALAWAVLWLWLAFSSDARSTTERILYRLPAVAAAIPIGVLFWRLIGNMQLIRERYESACNALGPNEPKPSDPTKRFFDGKPWRVPAALVTLGAATLAVLHFFGIDRVLLPP